MLMTLLSMFFSSFTSATILPGSSEVLFIALLNKGVSASWLLVSATLGNVLGSMLGYYLGKLGKWAILEKYLKIKEEKVLKWLSPVKKRESLFAFLSWVPIIGDFFPVALGVCQSNAYKVLFWIGVGKFLRYGFLLAGFRQLI